jgi:hypothetical protein
MVSDLVFMFCTPRLNFDDTEGVGSRLYVLRSRTHFRRCRVRRVPFKDFARPDSFSAIPRESVLVFMFCTLGFVFGGTEGVGSCFHVLRSRTRIRCRRCRVRRVPFSGFECPNSFSAVTRALVPIFMFCAPGLIFQRCRVRRVPFSCFALLESFPAVPRASFPVFMFCAPGIIFGGIEGVNFRLNVLRSRTHFRRY